jgi:hypothetical protein
MATFGRKAALAALVAALGAAGAATAFAGDAQPFTAREGEELARSAAFAWADDAHLVWVENDEDVTDAGVAPRWGYLFYSPARDAARSYSVMGGEIRVARDLPFAFPAPPLEGEWIDSSRALAAAEDEGGARFRRENAGRVRSMLLVRGILHGDAPDAATWAVVYESESVPGLWVVVDASSGKVVRTWRG